MTIPRTSMRLDMSGLIADWGAPCSIRRKRLTFGPYTSTVANPITTDAGPHGGSYLAGDGLAYLVAAYADVNGTRVYFSASASTVLRLISNNGYGVNISWTAVPNATGYILIRDYNADSQAFYADVGNVLTALDDGISIGTTSWVYTGTTPRPVSPTSLTYVPRNAAGQVSASFVSVGTETLWIQPFEGQSYGNNLANRIDPGILDKMTHQAFERYSGYAMQAEDQILKSGDTYVYDVLAVQILDTHRHLFLQQVKRS